MDEVNDVVVEETVDGCLAEVLIDQLKKTKELEPGSEQQKNALEGISKLAKVYYDDRNAYESRSLDLTIKQMEMEVGQDSKRDDVLDRKKDRWKDILVKSGEIAVTAIVTIACTKINIRAFRESFVDSLNFETDNSWSATASRGIANQMFNFLKRK